MTHIRAYIAPCAAYGWQGGPEFRTRIREMPNGRERRNGDWAQCRHIYTLPFMNISREAYAAIKQMHLVCRGRLHTFLYRDVLDYHAYDEVFDTGDGSQESFQLSKTSTVDGVSYTRNVYAIPDDETLIITIDDTPTTAFTLDRDRGIVTFDSPPSLNAVLRWSGNFDVWVRFDQDRMEFSLDNLNAHNGVVSLIEDAAPLEVAS